MGEKHFLLIALATPVLGAAIGRAATGKRRHRYAALGLGAGLVGPLAIVLYYLVSLTSSLWGLDSMATIIVCFSASLMLGIVWARIVRSLLEKTTGDKE